MHPQLSVIKVLLLVASLSGITPALAAQVGTVSHLSGLLFAQKADGVAKALNIGSSVDEGDTLITQANTYARVKLKDEAEIVLRPNTQLQLQKYIYDQTRPQDDNAVMRLLKGSFRTVTGWIGKRSNRDAYRMETPTATIGIRGTDYDTTHCPDRNSCGTPGNSEQDGTEPQSQPGNPPSEDVTFLQNNSGGNTISNGQGTQNLGPGQIAEAGRFSPPTLITPPIPPSRLFPPPPPSVGEPASPPPASGGSLGPGQSCQMR